MSRADFTPVNPNTTTRQDFTANILRVPIPSNADPTWSSAVKHQQALYKLLYDHPAMEFNRQQTFMTPAAQKSAIYHTWDFVGRTLQFLCMVDPSKAMGQRSGQDAQIAKDAVGRVAMSRMLVEDEEGMGRMMVGSNVDVQVEFGEEIKRAAAAEY